MITKTVGSGGDFATVYDACNWICTTVGGPLVDDYTFLQISDIHETARWNNGFAGYINLNGHSIILECIDGHRHNGNPTGGYVIYLDNSSAGVNFHSYGTDATNGRLVVKNVCIIRTSAFSSVPALQCHCQSHTTQDKMAIVENCIVIGKNDSPLFDVGINTSVARFRVNNIKLYRFSIATGIAAGGSNTLFPLEDRVYENVTIYSGGRGVYFFTSNNACLFKNVVVCGCTVACYQGLSNAKCITDHCADSDGTLVGGVGTINNIVAADEFESLDDTNEKFLFLKDGELVANPTANPNRGQAPLNVGFTANAQFTVPDGGVLYNGGTTPELSTTDITGLEYGTYGLYPIGCHNVRVIR